MPPVATAEPSTLTITSSAGISVSLSVYYLSQQGELVADTSQKKYPFEIHTVQNSMVVCMFPYTGSLPVWFGNQTGMEYKTISRGMCVVPAAAECSFEIVIDKG